MPPYTEASILLPSADTAIEVHNCDVARAVQLVPESCDTYTWPPLVTAAITATA